MPLSPCTSGKLSGALLVAALASGGSGCRAVLDLEEGVLVAAADGASGDGASGDGASGDGASDGSGDDGSADDGSADDVGPADTNPPDVGGPGGPRVLTFFVAAPDRSATYVCFVQFAKPGDETSQPPIASFGPWDKSGAGFAYGDVARLQADPALDAILASGNAFVFALDAKPSSGGEPCRAAWLAADKARSARIQVPAGGSVAIASTGCAGTGVDCGPGGNLALSVHALSTAPPEAGKVAVQFLHLSHYAGEGTGGAPSFQNADVHLQPMKTATTADGPSVVIAGTGAGVSFGAPVTPPVQLSIPGSGPEPLLLIAPHGASACPPNPPSPPACPTVPAPLDQARSPDTGRKLEAGRSYVVAVAGGPKDGTAGTLATFVARSRP